MSYTQKVFRCIFKVRKNTRKAVSPIIATVIIFGLIIIGVSIGFFQVVPYVERSQAETAYSSILSGLITLDREIQELIGTGTSGYTSVNPTTKVPINLPSGSLTYYPSSVDTATLESQGFHTINLRFLDETGTAIQTPYATGTYTAFPRDFAMGEFQYILTTNYDLTPQKSIKNLTGPNPYLLRPEVVIQSPTTNFETNYQGMENISTKRITTQQFISANYRPKIVIDIRTQPEMTISIKVFAIQFAGARTTTYTVYKDLTVKLTNILTLSWNSTLTNLDELQLQYRTKSVFSAWKTGFSTSEITGFTLGSAILDFRAYIYQVEMS